MFIPSVLVAQEGCQRFCENVRAASERPLSAWTNVRAWLSRRCPRLEGRMDPRQVMKTVTHGVVFENKLARQHRVAVKLNRSGAIEFVVR